MGRAGARLAARVATALSAPLDILVVHEARPAATDAPAVGAVAGDGTRCSDLAAAHRLGIPEWLLNYMLIEAGQRARAEEAWIRRHHRHHIAGTDAVLVVDAPASRVELHAAVRSLFAQGVASVHVLYASLQPDAIADLASLGASLITFDDNERRRETRLPSEGDVRRLMEGVNR
jgi:predicted phosphoribosyltransferase